MDKLPPFLLRQKILPFLSSMDMLALRLTCKSLKADTRGLSIYFRDLTSRRVAYWDWVYNVLLGICGCGTCHYFRSYYYAMSRRAGPRVLRNHLHSGRYLRSVSWNPDVTCYMMRGAIQSQCLHSLVITRGAVPIQYYNNEAIEMAVRYNNRKAFFFLLDMGHRPPIYASGLSRMFIMAGVHGTYEIVERMLSDDFANGDMTLIHSMAKEAVIYDNPDVIDLIDRYDLAEILDHELLLIAIRHDSARAFRSLLSTGMWVAHDDSDQVMAWRSYKVGRVWVELLLPCLPHTRPWFLSQCSGPRNI